MEVMDNNISSRGSKNKTLFLIISIIVIIATILSFGLEQVLNLQNKKDVNVLLIAPFKTDPKIADSMKDGAQVYIDIQNSSKNSDYHYVLDTLDEDSVQLLQDIKSKLSQKDYVSLIGFYNQDIFDKNKKELSALNIPVMTMSKSDDNSKNIYTFTQDQIQKVQFVSNYMRNVKKEYMTYFAHDNSSRCQMEQKEFDEVYKKFEIPLSGTVSTNENIKEYFEKVDYGSVYICGDDKSIPTILKEIKNSKTELNIYTNEMLALDSAKSYFDDKAINLHNISLPNPILFDTTTEFAQLFLNRYKLNHQKEPDWLSVLIYDMVKISFEKSMNPENKIYKGAIQDYDLSKQHRTLPVKMALFNGEQLISAPIQLQEIKNKNSISNYIDALRDNRVLYVNNDFMYKTNVVYTGVKINSISEINEDNSTAKIDFSVWFRYEGSFDAKSITFLNSNIKLDKPEQKIDNENSHYVRFRTTGQFKLNFFGKNRAYGINTINIVYRHKNLNQNNLLFVADILGMPSNAQMINHIKNRHIIDERSGWQINDFWISQDLLRDFSEGEPKYVGFSGEDTLFSTINIQVKIESSMLNAKDFIPKSAFMFLMILGFVGVVAAILMDRKKLGRYWYVQSYVLRLIFFPMFLMSSGNMLLDWAYLNLSAIFTNYLVYMYETTWWILPAYLLDLAIKRFVWEEIGEKVSKKIPHIIVVITTFVIYTLAICGAIAFVFEKELTSILAASGVLAMVIGLAIQANIANVFSGLILNMDRPFKVGESIVVEDMEGIVNDISWRATRIKTIDGLLVSIPNDTMSNVKTMNISRSEYFHKVATLHLSSHIDTDLLRSLIEEAVENVDVIIKEHNGHLGFRVYFDDYDFEKEFASVFKVYFTVKSYHERGRATDQIWKNLHKIAKREGISLID
jgi:small-conductance mechanosensitive channel